MTKYEKIEVAEACSEFHIDPGHRIYGIRYEDGESSPSLIFSGGETLCISTNILLLEYGDFYDTCDGPQWSDVLAAQYRLTNGHYLVVLDFASNNFRESTFFGRAVFHTSEMYFYHMDENGKRLREVKVRTMRARWSKQTEPWQKYRRPALSIKKVELLRPDEIRIETKDRLDFRISFFRNGPKRAPFDRGGLKVFEYSTVENMHVPYVIHRIRRVRWWAWSHVLDDIVDLLLGMPVRLFFIIIARP